MLSTKTRHLLHPFLTRSFLLLVKESFGVEGRVVFVKVLQFGVVHVPNIVLFTII